MTFFGFPTVLKAAKKRSKPPKKHVPRSVNLRNFLKTNRRSEVVEKRREKRREEEETGEEKRNNQQLRKPLEVDVNRKPHEVEVNIRNIQRDVPFEVEVNKNQHDAVEVNIQRRDIPFEVEVNIRDIEVWHPSNAGRREVDLEEPEEPEEDGCRRGCNMQ